VALGGAEGGIRTLKSSF